MKSYILVSASILLTVVALPSPASALYCFPDAPYLNDEVHCALDRPVQCIGDLAWTCAVVVDATSDAADAFEYAERTAHAVVENVQHKVRPEVEILLP